MQPVDGAVDGSPAVGSGEPDGDEPVGEAPAIARGVSWRPERVGVFDGEVGAGELVVLRQRPDDQVVDREDHTGPRRLEFPPYIAQRDLAGSYSMRWATPRHRWPAR